MDTANSGNRFSNNCLHQSLPAGDVVGKWLARMDRYGLLVTRRVGNGHMVAILPSAPTENTNATRTASGITNRCK